MNARNVDPTTYIIADNTSEPGEPTALIRHLLSGVVTKLTQDTQDFMRDKITTAVKTAMKAGEKLRLSTLRLMNAAIKDRDIAARVDNKGQATGKERVDDDEILALLQKMVKQRRESADIYKTNGRMELAAQEEAEVAIIQEFLPQQMSDEEAEKAINDVVDELGCGGLKDMGRVMSALKERFTGRMDFSKASAIVKARLK